MFDHRMVKNKFKNSEQVFILLRKPQQPVMVMVTGHHKFFHPVSLSDNLCLVTNLTWYIWSPLDRPLSPESLKKYNLFSVKGSLGVEWLVFSVETTDILGFKVFSLLNLGLRIFQF